MQQELRRYRKTLSTAERDLEEYRQRVLEAQERAKSRHGDETLDHELGQLRDKVLDLEAELREKERIIDEQGDEMVRHTTLCTDSMV
jgi:predicted  nucleic acid-binding Zn-ribbon protein